MKIIFTSMKDWQCYLNANFKIQITSNECKIICENLILQVEIIWKNKLDIYCIKKMTHK